MVLLNHYLLQKVQAQIHQTIRSTPSVALTEGVKLSEFKAVAKTFISTYKDNLKSGNLAISSTFNSIASLAKDYNPTALDDMTIDMINDLERLVYVVAAMPDRETFYMMFDQIQDKARIVVDDMERLRELVKEEMPWFAIFLTVAIDLYKTLFLLDPFAAIKDIGVALYHIPAVQNILNLIHTKIEKAKKKVQEIAVQVKQELQKADASILSKIRTVFTTPFKSIIDGIKKKEQEQPFTSKRKEEIITALDNELNDTVIIPDYVSQIQSAADIPKAVAALSNSPKQSSTPSITQLRRSASLISKVVKGKNYVQMSSILNDIVNTDAGNGGANISNQSAQGQLNKLSSVVGSALRDLH